MISRRQFVASMLASASVSVLMAASGEKVKQVESKYVCMITKKHFETEQTAVKVEDRTYYACCDMCKGQLLEDPSTRTAVDPVSGSKVDMATAVVGVDKAGNAYFFESVENLERFRVSAKSEK